MTDSQDKARTHALHARSQLDPAEREQASEVICEKVFDAHWFWRTEYLACYLPSRFEVDTWPIFLRAWRMKKRIFAPVIEKNGHMQFQEITAESLLRPNQYGIYEPLDGELITARKLDVVLTPLVAFDADCNRIGMGGGYYDRAFSFLKHRRELFRPKLIGLAFACQKVQRICSNPWDIPLFATITEES